MTDYNAAFNAAMTNSPEELVMINVYKRRPNESVN